MGKQSSFTGQIIQKSPLRKTGSHMVISYKKLVHIHITQVTLKDILLIVIEMLK